MLAHRVEQVERADEVAAVVALGELHGLGHEREGGEVQDAVEALGQGVARGLGVGEADLDEAGARGDRRAMPAREVVEHRDLVTALQQLVRDDGPDVARAARYEQLH